jgi:hypothetical protein
MSMNSLPVVLEEPGRTIGIPGLTAMPQMSVTPYSFVTWVSFQVMSTRTVKVTPLSLSLSALRH